MPKIVYSSHAAPFVKMARPNSPDNADCFYKIVLVGDLGIGKSSIFKRYRDGVFFENLSGTVGLDYFAKSIDIGNKKTIKVCTDRNRPICYPIIGLSACLG